MQRFILILDGSINDGVVPEWVDNIYLEVPYCLRINIGLLLNEWVSSNELQSKIKEFEVKEKKSVSDDSKNIEDASFTAFASIVHNACFMLKKYLNNNNNNNNNNHFQLECFWKFPTFQNTLSHNNINNNLIALFAAFQRFVEYNHGHIHIIYNDNDVVDVDVDVDVDDDNDVIIDDIDLFHINSWKQMFDKNCTIWNFEEIDSNFDEILFEIMRPFRLSSIALTMEWNNNNSFEFNFDLIPCFLSNLCSDSYIDNNYKHELKWKNWNGCYNWNCMKLLKVIQKQSFPSYLLISQIKLIQEQQLANEPILLILNPQNAKAKILTKHWLDSYSYHNNNNNNNSNYNAKAWIVQFITNNNKKLKENAFMSQSEWININLSVNDNNNNDNNDNDQNQNDKNTKYSSKYLIYAAYIKSGIQLIAHRIIDNNTNNVKNNMLNLTYKHSKLMVVDDDNDNHNNNTEDIDIISLPYFRYEEENANLIEANKQLSSTVDNANTDNHIWNNYEIHILSKHDKYIKNARQRNDNDMFINDDISPTQITSLLPLKFESNKRKKKKKTKTNKNTTSTNRGLVAFKNATQNSNIIQSAHLYPKKMCYRKNTKNVPLSAQKSLKFRRKKDKSLTLENILNIFNENGELRDKSADKYFESIQEEERENNNNNNNDDDYVQYKDWRKLREMSELNEIQINGNWPIQSRFYNEESLEYEEKILRIKNQYLNGVNNNNNNSFEIIGDIDLTHLSKYKCHPITIIHSKTNTNNKDNTNTNTKDNHYRTKNKNIIQSQIEILLKNEVNKSENIEKYRKLRTAIFDAMWNAVNRNKAFDCNKKMEKQILQNYVTKNFDGMFVLLSMQFN